MVFLGIKSSWALYFIMVKMPFIKGGNINFLIPFWLCNRSGGPQPQTFCKMNYPGRFWHCASMKFIPPVRRSFKFYDLLGKVILIWLYLKILLLSVNVSFAAKSILP